MEFAKVTSERQMEALREAQAAFAGEAERVGLETEEDVVAMVKELRKDRTVK